jgi:ketosteroid isomerase-like protein
MLTRAVVTLLFLLPVSCASVPAAPTPSTVSTVSAERELASIQDVLAAQQAAWNRGDVESYMSAGYWQSPDLVFLSGGTITRGYEPVLARYKANYQGAGKEMGRLAFSETELELLAPEVALARGRWELVMKDGKRIGGRYSLLLRKLSAGWRVVQDHSSID